GQADRAGTGDVHGRAWADAGGHAAMEASRKNVREQGQVADILQCLVRVGEFQQVEVGIGDHHVFGLPADPAAHVDIAVGGAWARRVDVQANAGTALLAVAATTASNVEGHGNDVSGLEELDVAPALENHPR